MSDIARPALRYRNPRPGGRHLIKFDHATENDRGDAVELILYCTRLPLWHGAGRRNTRRMLERIAEALRQNPGYEAVIAVPTLPLVGKTLGFIETCGLKGQISAGLYAPQ